MKYYIIFSLHFFFAPFFIVFASYAQIKYHVVGTSDRLETGDVIYLLRLDPSGGYTIIQDSSRFKDNSFEFVGTITESEKVKVATLDNKFQRVFILIPDSTISIYEKEDIICVDGGSENVMNDKYSDFYKSIYSLAQTLYEKADDSRDNEALKQLYKNTGIRLQNEDINVYAELLFRDEDLSIDALSYLMHLYYSKHLRTSHSNTIAYEKLSNRLKQHQFGQMFLDYIIGQDINTYPEIVNQIDTSGNILKFDFPSKGYVLVDFWASWCTSCLINFEKIKELYHAYHETKNFQVIGISLDDDSKAWKHSLKRFELPWINVSEKFQGHHVSGDDLIGIGNTMALKTASMNILPAYFLLNQYGDVMIRTNDLEKIVSYLNAAYGD